MLGVGLHHFRFRTQNLSDRLLFQCICNKTSRPVKCTKLISMHLEVYLCSVINGTVGVMLSKNNNFQKNNTIRKPPSKKKYKISSIKICFPNSMHSSFFRSHTPQNKRLAFQITCNYMFHPCHGARPWKMTIKVPYREQYGISF
jgi:hypothetical protein